MSDSLKIRPFKEYVQRVRGVPVLEISGRIEGDRFIVSALGSDINLNTVTVGRDKWGAFALVSAHEQSLPNGFQVRVEIEPDEDMPPGTVIQVLLENVSNEVAKALARIHHLDLNKGPLTPHERSFSVHFSHSGIPNGMTCSYVDEGKEVTVN